MNSINKTARFAGFLYLLLAPIGFFGIMYVPSTLIVEGDAATTIGNILANESLFRWGIVSSLVTQLLQIVLVLVLYKLLKAVNRSYAVLMVVFILVAVPIAMLNELNNFAALQLLSGTEFLSAFSQDQL
ncbi:MAG: DUF4386 family protein, partial [Bacteroidales bacterium]|nr:DUF4386 family protein [Bacteroidales bacterium]